MPRGRGRGKTSISNRRRRCEIHNTFITADGVCARCQESQRIELEQDVNEQDVVAINVPNPPDAPNDVEMSEEQMCDKCCPTSTNNYRLDFQTLQRVSLHTTMVNV